MSDAASARPSRRSAADACGRPDGLPAAGSPPTSPAPRTGRARAAARWSSSPTRPRCARLPRRCRCSRPKCEVLTLPGWDCLPYDRASPALRVMAERLATPERAPGQARQAAAAGDNRERSLAASADAVSNSAAHAAYRGRRADRTRGADRAAAMHSATSAPTRSPKHGEYAVRGSLIDVFPAGEELGAAARLLRRRDRQRAPLRSGRPALDRQGRRRSR